MTTQPSATSLDIDPLARHLPLGGLEQWLNDPTVTEVMVNRGSDVWVERHGELQRVGALHPDSMSAVLEHILAPLGRRLDRLHPWVDARLADGSRVCAAIPPIAIDGPCLSVRRFGPATFALHHFADTATEHRLLDDLRRRRNIVVSGGTSTGKTSLLNCLVALVPQNERVVTLEDVAELQTSHSHIVRLETRDATAEGIGEVNLASLLRVALRLRPDRIVVGEVRGNEAIHLLHALNTGHAGSLSTVHANSAHHALQRLAALVAEAAPAWSAQAIHDLVEGAIDVVVHLGRNSDGSRRVLERLDVAK